MSTTNPKANLAEKMNKKAAGGEFITAKAIYDFAVDGGAATTITPKNNSIIPNNAVIVGGSVNVTTAVLSTGSATVGVGTSAGSSTTAILGATAKASLSIDARLNAVPVFATPVKLTAAGLITVTVGTEVLTAGVMEITLLYYVANA